MNNYPVRTPYNNDLYDPTDHDEWSSLGETQYSNTIVTGASISVQKPYDSEMFNLDDEQEADNV